MWCGTPLTQMWKYLRERPHFESGWPGPLVDNVAFALGTQQSQRI